MSDQIIAIPIQDNSGGGGVPMPQRNDRADLIKEIKTEQIIEMVRQRLMGKEWINGNWQSINSLKEQALTEEGAFLLSNLLLGVANFAIALSKWNDEEIKKRARNIARTAQIMLVTNWISFGLKSTSQQYYVHDIIFTTAYAVLKQADEASIQELLKSTVYENRQVAQQKERMTQRIKRYMGM